MKLRLLVVMGALLAFQFAFAHGGDQRVVEGKYIVSVSRVPFTPNVGAKTSLIAYFFDMQKGKLVAEDIIATVRIAKLGEVNAQQQHYLFEQKGMHADRGGLEFSYAFEEEGIHEVFIEFSFADNPSKIYKPDDFMIDVQKSVAERNQTFLLLVVGIGGVLAGFAVSCVIKKM